MAWQRPKAPRAAPRARGSQSALPAAGCRDPPALCAPRPPGGAPRRRRGLGDRDVTATLASAPGCRTSTTGIPLDARQKMTYVARFYSCPFIPSSKGFNKTHLDSCRRRRAPMFEDGLLGVVATFTGKRCPPPLSGVRTEPDARMPSGARQSLPSEGLSRTNNIRTKLMIAMKSLYSALG